MVMVMLVEAWQWNRLCEGKKVNRKIIGRQVSKSKIYNHYNVVYCQKFDFN